MLIPLGILAGSGGLEGDYELIETAIVSGSSTSSVTFSNLGDYSSTYKHLQLRAVARTDNADNNDAIRIRFNSDTGSNYDLHSLLGRGAVADVVSNASLNLTLTGFVLTSGALAGASAFGAGILDILDVYAAKHKTLRSLSGTESVGQFVTLRSGAWRNTDSVTSITCSIAGTNFIAGSRLSLYGIRG